MYSEVEGAVVSLNDSNCNLNSCFCGHIPNM